MDEAKFKTTYHEMNPSPCIFSKAILSNKFGCEKFERLNIAERETINCNSINAHKTCATLLNLLSKNSQVALHSPKIDVQLPHNKAMKLQCGGLLGIRDVLELKEDIINIYAIVRQALLKFKTLENLPYQDIIGIIVHYEVRKRHVK